MKNSFLLSVVMPVYNEAGTLEAILQKVCQVNLVNGGELEVIIVDDASADNSVDIIKAFIASEERISVRLYEQENNQGKGAALHKGFEIANGDYIIIQDADLEYDPDEYNLLLKPILAGHADVVYGTRFAGDKPHRALFFWHTIGNKFLTFLSNVFTNLNLTDMETCYKLFKKEILDQVDLKEKRFGFEPEVTAKISRVKGVRVYEVGISYYGRGFEEGKKIGWKDGVRALYAILKYNVFSR